MSFTRLALISVSLTALSATAFAQTPPPAPTPAPAGQPAIAMPSAASAPMMSGGSKPVTRDEIPALVKEALINNPEILMEAAQKLRDKQAADAEKQAQTALQKHQKDIFDDPADPAVGNLKDADVTIVEFFDYHCGYCRHQLPAVIKLLGDDKKLRVVFKEFPILSEDSVTAARAALAVNRIAKDKYFDYHIALMKLEGKFDEKALLEIAKKQGISDKKLKEEMAKPEVTAILDKNRSLAEELGIHGTPGLIVGHELISGALSYEDLKKTVDDARSGKAPAPMATGEDAAPAVPAPIAAPPAAAPKPAAVPAPAAAAPAPKD